MLRLWIALLVIASAAAAEPAYVEGPELVPRAGWPVWLKDYRQGTRTYETSGLAYAGRDDDGNHCFFLADDIGFLRFCRVKEPGCELHLEDVGFHPSFLDSLAGIDALDFEALALDPPATLRDTLRGLLTLEGRGQDPRKGTRLIRIQLSRGEPGWQVTYLGNALADNRYWLDSTGSNRGLEGVAITEDFFYLGLETIERASNFNIDGTVLFIYDRRAERISAHRTDSFGIYSICGLAARGDTVTVVLDRNRQSLDVLCWDAEERGRLLSCHRFPLDLPAPDGLRYGVPSVEGVAIDDEGDIWCVTDPWHGHYQAIGAAPESLLVYLAAEIPMLYRYDGDRVWEHIE